MWELDEEPTEPRPSETADDVYGVVPPDPVVLAERFDQPILPPGVTESDEDDATDCESESFQFTLRDLFLLTVGVAVWLGVVGLLSWNWSIAAGVLGVAVFGSLAFVTLYVRESPGVRFAWLSLLVIYLITCLAAFMAGC
ncbi:MAG: hypothetical protein JW888_03965 [Pirellulales bacterium]|nr:hypothetical protein [Pirellulales bacterium]